MSPPSQQEEAVAVKDESTKDGVIKAETQTGKEVEESNITQVTQDVKEEGNDSLKAFAKSSSLTDETRLPEHQSGKTGLEAEDVAVAGNSQALPDIIDKELNQDAMESSIATLKPTVAPKEITDKSTISSAEEQDVYLDPTPKTPLPSQPPSRSASTATSLPRPERKDVPERSPTRSDAGFDEKASASEDEREGGSRSEIQTIMEQFSEGLDAPGQEEIMSPRLEIAGPLLGSAVQHPPRKSSLEPLNPAYSSPTRSFQELRLAPSIPAGHQQPDDDDDVGPPPPPKPGSIRSFSASIRNQDDRSQSVESPLSPPLHRPPPPEPEPEPDLPFDFHRFLEQLRHKTADPVAKFLRSFLQEFGKKQWMVHEQVKIIGDFLAFITNKMAQCEVWREVSDAEFDNAREGMEKLVMNRLYTQTFSPAIAPPQPISGSRSKRRGGERPMGPGRRGQHQEDVERDDILAQKVSIYGWIKEEHLDIPPVGDSGKRFLMLAQQEILKIKTYRAPRDKIICVLNCCKVIFGLLKHSKSDSSADSFMPLLIYVVLQANPEHLVSNVQYILRFRNQEKLAGEAGYYLSSLLGAVQFIENLDRTTLTISDEEFEKNVEAAVSAIAEKHQSPVEAPAPTQLSEKSTLSRPEVSPRHSTDGETSRPRKSTSSENETGESDEKAAITGLLRTIQKPLSSIGRIFSDEGSSSTGPARTPLPGNTPQLTPSPRVSSEQPPPLYRSANSSDNNSRGRLTAAEDAAARQASAEAAEAHRLQRAEHANVVETLASMFPDLDREIISDVVTQKNGRVGLAVDACLALSS